MTVPAEVVRRLEDLIEFEQAGDRWDTVTALMQVRDWLAGIGVDGDEAAAVPTKSARLYAREFAAEQLRKAAKWCEAEGYDEAAVDHLIVKAQELWP